MTSLAICIPTFNKSKKICDMLEYTAKITNNYLYF